MQAFTLLLVDDDLEDQLIFQEALNSLAYPVTCLTARDGMYALEMIQDATFSPPDIIFLDLNMPRMNGRELLQIARQNPDYQQVPIIIYSTSSSPEDINQCMAMGASTYVTKHGSFSQLRHDLRDLLHRYLPARALEQPA